MPLRSSSRRRVISLDFRFGSFASCSAGSPVVGEIKAELVKELTRNRHAGLPELVGVDAAAMMAESWLR